LTRPPPGGWYVDQFRWKTEFPVLVPNKELQTNDISPANGKMDLLTGDARARASISREGTKSRSRRQSLQPLMQDTLPTGVRRMPLELLRVTPLSPVFDPSERAIRKHR
jgi:hypothetical protein